MKTAIKQQWNYKQTPSEVWEYLTQAELMALWLMPNNFKAVIGHEFEFRTNPIPSLNLDGIMHCKVLEIIPFQKLVYTWKAGSGKGDFALDTIVEWTLEEVENGTKLVLNHSGFKDHNHAIFMGMTEGWESNIQKIVSHLNSRNLKIGIIGAGQIGGTLIRQYTKAGHFVKMANASGIENLKKLASETGASAVTLTEVVTDVDVIVIAIPLITIANLPKDLFKNTSKEAIIIDTSNYYPIRDGKVEAIENRMPESIWVSKQINRPVIKAYNSILAGSLVNSGAPKNSNSRLALPISGEDKSSKIVVSMLINDSGFNSFDYGTLEDSWKQQPGSPVYCTDLTLNQLKKSIIKAQKEVLSERRELGLVFIMKHNPELWMDWWPDFAKYNRIIYESDLDTI